MTSNIKQVPIDDLLFDFQNPRLSEFGINVETPQEEMLAKLWDLMGAEEIYLSIAASGFFEHEPLIVIKEPATNKYIVIEGNRRLAAVKAILSPGFIDQHGSSNLPKISEKIIDDIHSLPCIEATREDAWRFIGFKHVNGAAKWGSYAKAKFIAQIKNDYGMSISEIAKQIGDTTKIAEKLYQALMVIEQAEKNKIFSRDEINAPRLYFSNLYNSLKYENVKGFIGLMDTTDDPRSPIPHDKLNELGELLNWLFGSKKSDTKPLVVSQNPDLNRLSVALGSKESIAALRSSKSLEVAYEISLPDPLKFEQSLNAAKRELYEVQKYLATGFDGKSKELLQTAVTIADLADSIFYGMKEKFESHLPKQPKKRTI